MRKSLTAKLIENLKPLPHRRYEVRDTLLPGFGVRVSRSGKRTWFAVGRVDGRLVRHTLGSYPTISLSEAREAARMVLKDMQLGSYAPARPELVVALPTLKAVICDFIEIYARPKNRGWKAVRSTLGKFSSLNDRPLKDISRVDIVIILDQIVARGSPIAANRALSAIKKVFAWALDRGVISVHPLVGLKRPSKESSRDRVLSDEELRLFWNTTLDLGFPFGSLLQLLLLTGQRRGEVSAMRWSQLDAANAIWTIPAELAKNGRAHEVPLSSAALDIISSLPRFAKSDFVFTTTGTTPVSGFGRIKKRIDLGMSSEDWRVHDLRRTAASGMARLGISPHVIEKILNHISGQISGVAAVYNRHGYQKEKGIALDAWADEIHRITDVQISLRPDRESRRIRSDVQKLVPARAKPLDRPVQARGI